VADLSKPSRKSKKSQIKADLLNDQLEIEGAGISGNTKRNFAGLYQELRDKALRRAA
jgi:hypothetical protein